MVSISGYTLQNSLTITKFSHSSRSVLFIDQSGMDLFRKTVSFDLCWNIGMHHQEYKSMKVHEKYTTLTPLLYSKTGVYMGIPVLRIFAKKHRLWVLVRTAV